MKLEFSLEDVKDTHSEIIAMKKKLHAIAETFLIAVKQSGEFEDYEPGVHIRLYHLDGGEDDLYFHGVNIMRTYSEWLVTLTVTNKPGIKLKIVDHPGVQHVTVYEGSTILVDGYAEDALATIRERKDWKGTTDEHSWVMYYQQIDPDMTNLDSALLPEKQYRDYN